MKHLLVQASGWWAEQLLFTYGQPEDLDTTCTPHRPASHQSSAEKQLPESFLWTCWGADTDNRHALAHQTRTGQLFEWFSTPSWVHPGTSFRLEWRETGLRLSDWTSAGRQQLQSPDVWSHYDFSGDWIINSQIDFSILSTENRGEGKSFWEISINFTHWNLHVINT